MRAIAGLITIAMCVSGCAVASQQYVAFPIHGQPPDLQMKDRMECEGIAQANKGSDADAAAAMGALGAAYGVVSGAAYGAILGAVAHGISAGRGSVIGLAVGGAAGLIAGIVSGIAENNRRYQAIYVACMTARGYTLGG